MFRFRLRRRPSTWRVPHSPSQVFPMPEPSGPAGGDLFGTYPDPQVRHIDNVAIGEPGTYYAGSAAFADGSIVLPEFPLPISPATSFVVLACGGNPSEGPFAEGIITWQSDGGRGVLHSSLSSGDDGKVACFVVFYI